MQLELFHYEKVPFGHCPECYRKGSVDRDHDWNFFCFDCMLRVNTSKWETVVYQDFPYTVDTH